MPPKKGTGPAAKKPRVNKSAHQLADPLPAGTVLKDFTKQEWKLGKPIGSGGFGLIYLTDKCGSGPVADNAAYVLKLEPHSNGPLFCELHFYQRAAKQDMNYVKRKKLKHLGMPKYIASGSHELKGVKYRFMVMERFGSDLQKLFEKCNKSFPYKTVLTLGIRVLETLEYIHSKEYCHADIKASNLLLGYENPNQVYLVDYGLASKYISDGKVKEYKADPRRCHDGTIEFTSTDAHQGVAPGRRGDLEILGFCLLQWCCGRLPWEDKLTNKEYVRDQKVRYMGDIPQLMKTCFGSKHTPDGLQTFLEYVKELDYTEQPDYDYLKTIFSNALKAMGLKNDGKLDFSASAGSSVGSSKMGSSPRKAAKAKPGKRAVPKTVSSSDEEDFEVGSPVKVKKMTSPQCKTKPPKGTPRTPKSSAARKGHSPSKARKPQASLPIKVSSTESSASTPKSTTSKKSSNSSLKSTPKLLANGKKSDVVPSSSKWDVPGTSVSDKPKARKRKVPSASIATQTSPGLKGLKRSRKM